MLLEIEIENEKRGRGYIGYSKSVNAINAEALGLFPASQIAKLTKTSTDFIKNNFEPQEWHHTSKFYNQTLYYSLQEIEDFLLENPNAFKAWKKINKGKKFTRIAEIVQFYEWIDKRPVTIELTDIAITYNGKSSYSFEHEGKIITKREGTKGFYIAWKPTEEELKKYEELNKRLKEAEEREANLWLASETKDYEEGIANGTYLDVPEFMLEKVLKKQSKKFWIAVQKGKVADAICMYHNGFDFESYRQQSRDTLAQQGKVLSAKYYFFPYIKKHIFTLNF